MFTSYLIMQCFNMTLVGLKLFQDVLVVAVSDNTTRANSSFLRMTETGCRITAGNAHILDMVLSIGKKKRYFGSSILKAIRS